MCEKHTRRTRMTKQERITSSHVTGKLSVFAISIVIVDKCYSVALISIHVDKPCRLIQRTVTFPYQFRKVHCRERVVQGKLEREVESGRCAACSFNPVDDIVVAVPIFTDRELSLYRFVVCFDVACTETFHHIITPAHIAEIIVKEIEISLDVALHFRISVVQIAATAKIVTCIIITSRFRRHQTISHFIVFTNGIETELISFALIFFSREIIPVGSTVTVVDYHIFNNSRSEIAECANHVAQFLFRSERRVVIGKPINRIVSHTWVRTRATAVWHPNQIEIVGKFTGL